MEALLDGKYTCTPITTTDDEPSMRIAHIRSESKVKGVTEVSYAAIR